MHNDILYWLAATSLPKVGPRKFLQWMNLFSSIKELFVCSREELIAKGLTNVEVSSLKNINWKWVEAELQWGQQSNQTILCIADPNYPSLLKEMADPPLIIYIRGNQTLLSQPQIAIVGSRSATPIGLKNAKRFAYELTQVGMVITSGLALGIDGASHRGAIEANGLTLGVAGTGLHHIYPKSHSFLVNEMLAHGGAIVSEFALAIRPLPANFPRRNRLIAGLSMGVLVVEAALKSGSLVTARHAVEQGKEVFAIPGSIHQVLYRGCHHLIRQGAKLVETTADILEEISMWNVQSNQMVKHEKLNKLNSASLSHALQKLLEQIEYEITPMDVIILRSGLTANEVSSMLLTLELAGYIESVAGGYVRTIDE